MEALPAEEAMREFMQACQTGDAGALEALLQGQGPDLSELYVFGLEAACAGGHTPAVERILGAWRPRDGSLLRHPLAAARRGGHPGTANRVAAAIAPLPLRGDEWALPADAQT